MNLKTNKVMTAKEKADELYSKYDDLLNKDFGNPIVFDNQLKQCALIAVDEILDFMFLSEIENSFWINYYNKVKQEISNI